MRIEKPGLYETVRKQKVTVTEIQGGFAIGWVTQSGIQFPVSWKTSGDVWNSSGVSRIVAEWREPVSRTLNLYLVNDPIGLVILDETMTQYVPPNAIAHKRVTITEGEGMEPSHS